MKIYEHQAVSAVNFDGRIRLMFYSVMYKDMQRMIYYGRSKKFYETERNDGDIGYCCIEF